MNALDAWDRAATLWLNSFHTPGSDAFWAFLSRTQVWYPLYALVIALLIWRLGWKRGLLAVAACILTLVLSDQLCNLVKAWAQRPRPCHDEAMLAAGLHAPHPNRSPYGFFSAHAANTFSFVLCSTLLLRRFRKTRGTLFWLYPTLLFPWAALVSFSRIMLGAHYLGDILSGAAFGLLLAWIVAWIFSVKNRVS